MHFSALPPGVTEEPSVWFSAVNKGEEASGAAALIVPSRTEPGHPPSQHERVGRSSVQTAEQAAGHHRRDPGAQTRRIQVRPEPEQVLIPRESGPHPGNVHNPNTVNTNNTTNYCKHGITQQIIYILKG